jgi:hypothetical protein
MPAKTPRLRGSAGKPIFPWPVGQVPDDVVHRIAERLVHYKATGRDDISGDDFADIAAYGVKGINRKSPLGIVDVTLEGCGWTAKTVQDKEPKVGKSLDLISGRNSPDYSLGISDPRTDINATGKAVLAIWNQRVKESLEKHDDLRLFTLVRNMDVMKFALFEDVITSYPPDNYEWKLAPKKTTIWGYDKTTDERHFRWQFHGSQFTVFKKIPGSARLFSVNRPIPVVPTDHVMKYIKFQQDWIDLN